MNDKLSRKSVENHTTLKPNLNIEKVRQGKDNISTLLWVSLLLKLHVFCFYTLKKWKSLLISHIVGADANTIMINGHK